MPLQPRSPKLCNLHQNNLDEEHMWLILVLIYLPGSWVLDALSGNMCSDPASVALITKSKTYLLMEPQQSWPQTDVSFYDFSIIVHMIMLPLPHLDVA